MMHKLLVSVLLGALIGLVVWDILAPASVPGARTESPNFKWVDCPSCARLFSVEKDHQEGWCPYDGSQVDFSSGE